MSARSPCFFNDRRSQRFRSPRRAELGYHQSSSHTDEPFLCAVGLANIEIIEREGLVANAARQGAYLKKALEGRSARQTREADRSLAVRNGLS